MVLHPRQGSRHLGCVVPVGGGWRAKHGEGRQQAQDAPAGTGGDRAVQAAAEDDTGPAECRCAGKMRHWRRQQQAAAVAASGSRQRPGRSGNGARLLRSHSGHAAMSRSACSTVSRSCGMRAFIGSPILAVLCRWVPATRREVVARYDGTHAPGRSSAPGPRRRHCRCRTQRGAALPGPLNQLMNAAAVACIWGAAVTSDEIRHSPAQAFHLLPAMRGRSWSLRQRRSSTKPFVPTGCWSIGQRYYTIAQGGNHHKT